MERSSKMETSPSPTNVLPPGWLTRLPDGTAFSELTEAQWSDLWLQQAETGRVAGLPPLVDIPTQMNLHGTTGVGAMAGALKFRQVILREVGSPGPNECFVDFGCGWGRHIRVFSKDYTPDRMTGVDINPTNIALCRRHLPTVRFLTSTEGERLEVAPASIDLIISFSVFSHLSEPSARFWLRELARICRPGGSIVVTSWGRSLFRIFDRLQKGGEIEYNWEKNIIRAFPDLKEVERLYLAGGFVFGRHGSTDANLDPDRYGISLMPRRWIEENTGLCVDTVIDDPVVVPQTTFFLKRP